jgi:hypothetical protein
VLSMGHGPRRRYAARRALRGNQEPLPLFQIDEEGRSSQVGQLHLAHPSGCVVQFESPWAWPTTDDMRDGWFDGIPYPLQDMRPEGFLGRQFAHDHAAVLQVSTDPRKWSDDDALHALSLFGTDAVGNHIIGQAAYRRWLDQSQKERAVVAQADVASRYVDLAQQALQQGHEGSSAGGEFPKFVALRELNGQPQHVLVKFSGSDDSPGTRRWADLLVCEHIASQVVNRLAGLNGSVSRIVEAGGRTLLEVVRFDRHGIHGRSGVCSWAAINQDWFGQADSWAQGAKRLLEARLVDVSAHDAVVRLWHFGRLIGNTDMHDHNLSFTLGSGMPLRLAPVYDMLPMLYAPVRGVELAPKEFAPQLPLPAERPLWREAAGAALNFWQLAGADGRISEAFRAICSDNASRLRAAMDLPAAKD